MLRILVLLVVLPIVVAAADNSIALEVSVARHHTPPADVAVDCSKTR